MRLLRLGAPVAEALEADRRALASEPLSYSVGILDGKPPDRMRRDSIAVDLGAGEEVWARATAAIDSWTPFDLGWASIATGGETPRPGLDVVVVARILGVHVVVGSRVVAVHDSREDGSRRYGFTYGSLTSHVESGEERFEVTMDDKGRVTYRIDVLGMTARWYATLATPLVEVFRRRFRRDSAAAMVRSTRG